MTQLPTMALLSKINLILLFSVSIILTTGCDPTDPYWIPVFNGKDLSRFTKLNGDAEFTVVDNTIVGTSKENTPNTFLALNQEYGDFIFEFEVLIDSLLNSGVQFRSISNPEIKKGRVHGYQVEIETSPRKWSGGIYDEARRQWLYPLTQNESAQNAFVQGEWNHYKIQAIGAQINTWVNGVHCSRLIDDLTPSGIIALQVHSIYNEEQEGKQVRWRNLRIRTEKLEEVKGVLNPEVPAISYLKNELSAEEKDSGWKLLWDGKSTEGWKGANAENSFPEKGWTIENGALICQAATGEESTNGGDIITTDSYSNFILELEFKITKGANSGIKYFVDPTLHKGQGSAIGLEFQILDDENHPDAQAGKNGNRTLGALYDLIPAQNLSEVNRDTKRFFGIGAWNKARIVAKNGKVEHWLNNVKVLEYNRFSTEFKVLVQDSKYKKWPNFGQLKSGPILLQDHGNQVHFRSIKIKTL